MKTLLSIDTNAKTVKGQKRGYMTGILYLAPSDESDAINTCPHASKGCRAACLFTAGRGAFDNVRQARINKTLWFVRDREGFIEQIKKDIAALVRKAERKGLTPCVRLNGTSDLPVETWGIMEEFPDVQFYDYTKNYKRMCGFLDGPQMGWPKNYTLTFSRAETTRNRAQCGSILERGGNVAAVFAGKTLPKTYKGKRVVNGDETDLRFLDPRNVIMGLTAKGKARKDDSGFAINLN